MRHTRFLTCWIGALTLVVVAGCSLNRGAPPTQHYVLGGGRLEQNVPAVPEGGEIALGIRRLKIAPYLESTSIVVRGGARGQELVLSEFHRWSEPLDEGIKRAVAGYLTAGGAFRAVDVAPWPAGAKHDLLLELHVLRFEGVAPAGPAATEGEVHLLATWAIVRADDGEVLARGTTDVREPGWRLGDYAGLVALLDAGVSVLAADLVNDLANLPVW